MTIKRNIPELIYGAYLKVCKEAVSDVMKFADFKRDDNYRKVLEHLTYEEGQMYLEAIREHPLMSYLIEYATNDLVGHPYTYKYPELEIEISPTTLRYMKVAFDLFDSLESLDGWDIVEIGAGYGGQCKIIYDIFKPRSYTIIDLPEVLDLSVKYLNIFSISPIVRETNDPSEIPYDLCISNYAFTEIKREYQDFYAEKIIKYSKKGYMTCNFMDGNERYSREEIWGLKENGLILMEVPRRQNITFYIYGNMYSQVGQDDWVLSVFGKDYVGFFMDIGCNNPKEINNTLWLEEHGWEGVAYDATDYSKQWSGRKTQFIHTDVLTYDFAKANLPKVVDYASIDIDTLGTNYAILKRLLEAGFEFKTITIEHNLYGGVQFNERDRLPQRALLTEMGYTLARGDVKNDGNAFEDWWINEKYFK